MPKFKVNDRVRSEKHGVGTVQKVDEFSSFMTYLVRFRNGTIAWLPKKEKENKLTLMQD